MSAMFHEDNALTFPSPVAAQCRPEPWSLLCVSWPWKKEGQTIFLAPQRGGCSSLTAPLFLRLGEILLANRFFWLIALKLDVFLG